MLPLLAGSMIASAAFIVGTVHRLPAEVASHFGGVGANGLMAHDEYLWWMLGLALVVPGAAVLLAALVIAMLAWTLALYARFRRMR
ncbi:MAG: hypothetical protein ACREYD_12825 [Casimicrobiaceae bacterium]